MRSLTWVFTKCTCDPPFPQPLSQLDWATWLNYDRSDVGRNYLTFAGGITSILGDHSAFSPLGWHGSCTLGGIATRWKQPGRVTGWRRPLWMSYPHKNISLRQARNKPWLWEDTGTWRLLAMSPRVNYSDIMEITQSFIKWVRTGAPSGRAWNSELASYRLGLISESAGKFPPVFQPKISTNTMVIIVEPAF